MVLTAPPGVTFDSLAPPQGATYIDEIIGEGTGQLVIRFLDGESRPSTIEFTLAFGTAAPATEFKVLV